MNQKRRKDGGTLGPNINNVAGIEPHYVTKNLVPLHFALYISKFIQDSAKQPIRMPSTQQGYQTFWGLNLCSHFFVVV